MNQRDIRCLDIGMLRTVDALMQERKAPAPLTSRVANAHADSGVQWLKGQILQILVPGPPPIHPISPTLHNGTLL